MKSPASFLPLLLLLLAMVSIQIGASIAKSMFAVLGAEGATALRLALATALLLLVFRPWRGGWSTGMNGSLLGYGLALGVMNLCFYLALERVPMGIVVAIEFLGPLGVAIHASRRGIDLAWVALAVAGLALLLPLGTSMPRLDPLGVLFALLAAAGWAAYIVYGKRAGGDHGGRTVTLGMLIASLAVLPAGVVHSGLAMLDPAVLPIGLAVAILSSALPYTLEMYALTRIPTRTFGILMSLEPAIAACAGLIVLGERLNGLQWLAVGSVMLASLGSVASSPRREVSP